MSNELRNRIIITIELLILVQIISFIPIPGVNVKWIYTQFDEQFSLFLIQKLRQFSITALGILPYLAASMLVMTVFYLLRFKRGLDEHKYRLHLYTIILTIIWIIVQSRGLIRYSEYINTTSVDTDLFGISGFIFKIGVVISLLGGTLILVWIAHLITNFGIGNGLILIIGLGLLNRWLPAFLNLLKNVQQIFNQKFSLFFILVDLIILIVIIVSLLLANWDYELKLSNGQQSNRSFLTKFPLLLIGVFPIFFLPNFKLIFGSLIMNWRHFSPISLIINAIIIVFLTLILILVVYQPKRLQQLKSRFFPESASDNTSAFDKKLIRIFILYILLMLLVWGVSLILQIWFKDSFKLNDYVFLSRLVYLFIIIAIIIDVYYQIKTHHEMYKFYTVSENDGEPLFCEECNEQVASDDKYCRYCGANFVEGAKCVYHPEKPAEYQCVVCSKPLCTECSISIKKSHRCADHEFVEIREGWSKIQIAATFVEAQFIQEILKNNDITSMIFSNVMGSNYGAIKLWQLTPVIPFMVARWLGGGEIKIFVPAEDYQRSLNLLKKYEHHLKN